ncbi:MAG TPA: hypothetical protein DIW31_04720 [Bacteroidales bacterium]|nr:hypothetical protein [Bacteroidales bacterium]
MYASALLLIVSFTGIFLRPPFIILVANGGVNLKSDPKTISEVFWTDKLRDIKYDAQRDIYLLGTSDGVFYSRSAFSAPLEQFSVEPPISIMGINVFEILENGNYLVGSFSGAYYWNPYTGVVVNYFTGQPVQAESGLSSPFGSFAIAGYSKVAGNEYFFDYDKGLIAKETVPAFDMPQNVKDSFPFPLWNLAQEVHTCRIYSPLIGLFYILIVPLAGISLFFVTITGAWMWLMKRRRQNSDNRQPIT